MMALTIQLHQIKRRCGYHFNGHFGWKDWNTEGGQVSFQVLSARWTGKVCCFTAGLVGRKHPIWGYAIVYDIRSSVSWSVLGGAQGV